MAEDTLDLQKPKTHYELENDLLNGSPSDIVKAREDIYREQYNSDVPRQNASELWNDVDEMAFLRKRRLEKEARVRDRIVNPNRMQKMLSRVKEFVGNIRSSNIPRGTATVGEKTEKTA